jgi:hypothetical protein
MSLPGGAIPEIEAADGSGRPRKATLASFLAKTDPGIRFNEHIEGDGATVLRRRLQGRARGRRQGLRKRRDVFLGADVRKHLFAARIDGAGSLRAAREELTMAQPGKSKTDLFTSMEDDIKQFWRALSGALRAAPGALAKRVGQITQATRPPSANEKD